MKKPERSRGEPITSSWLDWMARLLRGSLLAGVVVLLGLLVGAACISHGILSQGQMDGVVLASCVVGTLCGGIFAIGRQGMRAIPMGLGVGVILFLLCMTGGIVVYGNTSLGTNGVGVLCASLCGGTMAGVLCRKSKKKNRH